jgi:hypothetical protein
MLSPVEAFLESYFVSRSAARGGAIMKLAKIFPSMVLSCLFGSLAFAASVEEVALYNKADRQKVLIEGAKKEGKITWYTSLIVDQLVRPMKEAFEKEYPFLQLEYFRGNSERLGQKMFAEYQGKR